MTSPDAHEQIRQLAARYALAMDRRDFAALAVLFTDDCATLGGGTGRAPLEAEFTSAFRTGTGGRWPQPPADWPRGIVGRGTLPYAWPTWRAFAGEPS